MRIQPEYIRSQGSYVQPVAQPAPVSNVPPWTMASGWVGVFPGDGSESVVPFTATNAQFEPNSFFQPIYEPIVGNPFLWDNTMTSLTVTQNMLLSVTYYVSWGGNWQSGQAQLGVEMLPAGGGLWGRALGTVHPLMVGWVGATIFRYDQTLTGTLPVEAGERLRFTAANLTNIAGATTFLNSEVRVHYVAPFNPINGG